MNENQKTAVGVAIGSAFTLGFFMGEHFTRKAIAKRLNQKKMMIGNGLVSAVMKARENNWTHEEFAAELGKELEFIKIVDN